MDKQMVKEMQTNLLKELGNLEGKSIDLTYQITKIREKIKEGIKEYD